MKILAVEKYSLSSILCGKHIYRVSFCSRLASTTRSAYDVCLLHIYVHAYICTVRLTMMATIT